MIYVNEQTNNTANNRKKYKILMLESFYGGSHRAFADGLIKNSNYTIDLITMPGRFWKWRMKGASLYFAEKIKNIEEYDLIITTDLISISDLKTVLGSKCPPVILYFHENQLAYPLKENEKLDYHYGLTDFTNSIGADKIIFNSKTHMSAFFRELPLFLKHLPDFIPEWPFEQIKSKSIVIYPGINDSAVKKRADKLKNSIPIIIWNHRWEFDKNPETFFMVLFKIKDKGIPFQLVLLGENYKKQPPVFTEAAKRLNENIIHSGYVGNYGDYLTLLKRGDIVISTSNQENYGIAVIEAILAGCMPLLPDRLSYPEIIPAEFHSECLFIDENDLEKKLKNALKGENGFKQNALIDKMTGLCWKSIIDKYDTLFDELINREN